MKNYRKILITIGFKLQELISVNLLYFFSVILGFFQEFKILEIHIFWNLIKNYPNSLKMNATHLRIDILKPSPSPEDPKISLQPVITMQGQFEPHKCMDDIYVGNFPHSIPNNTQRLSLPIHDGMCPPDRPSHSPRSSSSLVLQFIVSHSF